MPESKDEKSKNGNIERPPRSVALAHFVRDFHGCFERQHEQLRIIEYHPPNQTTRILGIGAYFSGLSLTAVP
jgi:hypothetical protein